MNRSEMLIVRRVTMPTGEAKAHVEACVAEGTCLCCRAEKAVRRGLGTKCYWQWRTSRQKLTQDQAANYDAKLIKQGKLLPSHKIVALKAPNVFSDTARSVGGEG